MSSTNHNIIFYSGSRDKTFCGYCKTENASYSNGENNYYSHYYIVVDTII